VVRVEYRYQNSQVTRACRVAAGKLPNGAALAKALLEDGVSLVATQRLRVGEVFDGNMAYYLVDPSGAVKPDARGVVSVLIEALDPGSAATVHARAAPPLAVPEAAVPAAPPQLSPTSSTHFGSELPQLHVAILVASPMGDAPDDQFCCCPDNGESRPHGRAVCRRST
jgi:hypothetical protein